MNRYIPILLALCCAQGAVLRAAGAGAAEPLTLADAEAQAMRNHPRLAAAQIQAIIAQEGVRATEAGFFPTIQAYLTAVDAGNENTRILAGALNNPSIYDRAAGGLGISQLITDFGHTNNLAAGSKLQARGEAENANATREQIRLGVDVAYFTALQARAVLRVAKQTVETESLLANQVKALASNQLKSGLDVSFAMVGFEQAMLVSQKAEGDDGAAQAALAAAMGLHEPRRFDLADVPASNETPVDASGLIAEALRSRPDLARLRDERDAAYRYARAENDLNYPTLSAVGDIGDSPTHDSHLPDHYAAAGVQLSLPLFAGGLYTARQHQAQLRAQIADENLRDAEDSVVHDVQVARLNFDTAEQQFNTAQQLVQHADEAFQLAQARYRQGSSSIVELSQAQLNDTSAAITLAVARYGALIQRAILSFQSGTL
jgi:outer membrane protein